MRTPRASLTVEQIGAIPPDEPPRWRKPLLLAQRDYHPDRNAGAPHEALGHTVDEWEVICLEVSQRLSRKSDQLYRPAMSPEQSRKIREAQEAQEGL